MIYKDVLRLIGGTPLVQINRLNPNKKVRILAKLEGNNPTGSIKDRIALKMILAAEKEGRLTKNKTIIEATSGNTGIALAMIGAIKGYGVEIVMSRAVSIERQKMIRAFGAKITLTEARGGTDQAILKTKELLRKYPKKYFWTNQFSNKYNKLSHYQTTAREIWQQTKGRVDYFVSAVGTSGTLMGVSAYLKKYNPQVKVISAEPSQEHYIQGLKNMEEALIPEIYDRSKIDQIIKIDTEEAFAMSRQIIKKEGIFVGMSSGAAMIAAREVAKKIKAGTVVVIFPDRGEKYLSTELFSGL